MPNAVKAREVRVEAIADAQPAGGDDRGGREELHADAELEAEFEGNVREAVDDPQGDPKAEGVGVAEMRFGAEADIERKILSFDDENPRELQEVAWPGK